MINTDTINLVIGMTNFQKIKKASRCFIGVSGPTEYMVKITKYEAAELVRNLQEDYDIEINLHENGDSYIYVKEKPEEHWD